MKFDVRMTEEEINEACFHWASQKFLELGVNPEARLNTNILVSLETNGIPPKSDRGGDEPLRFSAVVSLQIRSKEAP